MTIDRRCSGISDRRDLLTEKTLDAETRTSESSKNDNSENTHEKLTTDSFNQQLVQANENLIIASIKCQTIAENLEKSSAQMIHLANHDFLTELPNRMQLNDRIGQAILLAKRDKSRLAVLFLDLDKFKAVNDSYGHGMGDKLLQSVAARLQNAIRSSDTASRQGGDEFILLLSNIGDKDSLCRTIKEIQQIISASYLIAETNICIGSAIGVSVFPEHGEDTQTLIHCADIAMYYAKQRGPNQYEIFNPDIHNASTAGLE
ncbi:MAG: GGDEF domain-containing protein [Herminiimonas sp.]|uniref:GGDEF domain-containing protein n=1 Tax=Herminiimonas sp. TaxID=1926289 RepID=UPI0027167B11|nr:GGDEF domain-containing protein [Herminiimonas sp.]MDO9422479.1 GGDEF domain-containing protein [Herminiimonas sp.]